MVLFKKIELSPRINKKIKYYLSFLFLKLIIFLALSFATGICSRLATLQERFAVQRPIVCEALQAWQPVGRHIFATIVPKETTSLWDSLCSPQRVHKLSRFLFLFSANTVPLYLPLFTNNG